MEGLLIFLLLVLGTLFVSSFVVLIILCRYKNLRRKTVVYVKRLARADNSNSDFELIKQSEKQCIFQDLDCANGLDSRCRELLEICNAIDFSYKEISAKDIDHLRYVINVARSITEDSHSKIALFESHTLRLLLQVSKTMSRMEDELKACTLNYSFQGSDII